MKLTKAQMLEKIKPFIGDRTDDETLSLLEDIKDTIVESTNDDAEKYKKMYDTEVAGRKEDNENWAKKYRDAFFNPQAEKEIEKEKEKEKEENEEEKELTFDNLFKKGE